MEFREDVLCTYTISHNGIKYILDLHEVHICESTVLANGTYIIAKMRTAINPEESVKYITSIDGDLVFFKSQVEALEQVYDYLEQ